MPTLRRLRAATVLAGTWAAAWAVFGAAVATVRVFFLAPHLATPAHYWPQFARGGALLFGTLGLVAGVGFAIALSRRRDAGSVDDLSDHDSARWGAIGGAAAVIMMPFVGLTGWPILLCGAVIGAAVGSSSAALTVSIARRSTPRIP